MRVAVLGAAGGIGQPLCMLLKLQLPADSTLLLYDLAGVEGVAADLSHIDTQVTTHWAQGTIPPTPRCTNLSSLIVNADVVIICAGIARKPGMTRDDLFNTNAEVVFDLVTTCATVSPNAAFGIITNPVNSTVPIAAEALRKLGCYNRDKLFGITTLDVLRATQFINEKKVYTSAPVSAVPVVGGHSGSTIVPLFSHVLKSGATIPEPEWAALIDRVQNAGTEVVNAKAGKGSATLSMAAAGARFTLQLVHALINGCGQHSVTTYSYVDVSNEKQTVYKGLCEASTNFLAVPLRLGKKGIAERLAIGPMSTLEAAAFKTAVGDLNKNIEQGMRWAKSKL